MVASILLLLPGSGGDPVVIESVPGPPGSSALSVTP